MIQNAVTENFSMLTRFSMQVLISIGLMFYVSAKLTAVLLSVVPIIVVSAVQYGELVILGRGAGGEEQVSQFTECPGKNFVEVNTLMLGKLRIRTMIPNKVLDLG